MLLASVGLLRLVQCLGEPKKASNYICRGFQSELRIDRSLIFNLWFVVWIGWFAPRDTKLQGHLLRGSSALRIALLHCGLGGSKGRMELLICPWKVSPPIFHVMICKDSAFAASMMPPLSVPLSKVQWTVVFIGMIFSDFDAWRLHGMALWVVDGIRIGG